MGDEIPEGVDLFGDAWTPPRDPRGRKRHRRQAQVAEKVAVLRGVGNTVEQIARRIGLSEPTLRKYYLRELEQGSDLAMAVLDEVIWQRAMAGSVSAARLMKEALTKGGAATPIARVRAKAAAPLGKKAEANLAAQTAHEDSEWANLLPN
jgi:hypothetical protein